MARPSIQTRLRADCREIDKSGNSFGGRALVLKEKEYGSSSSSSASLDTCNMNNNYNMINPVGRLLVFNSGDRACLNSDRPGPDAVSRSYQLRQSKSSFQGNTWMPFFMKTNRLAATCLPIMWMINSTMVGMPLNLLNPEILVFFSPVKSQDLPRPSTGKSVGPAIVDNQLLPKDMGGSQMSFH
eukprot:Gb_07295 [translate_table: standard]